ncbi:MAG: patatin-like phospholipase family protein [Desulfovibrio sp.]
MSESPKIQSIIDPDTKTFGLALGSGGARGLAHVGFLQKMYELGFRPQCISGTSMGALVGAIYAGGDMDAFTKWLLELGPADFFRFIDLTFPKHGLIDCTDLMDELEQFLHVQNIEDCRTPLAIVASNGITGEEVILTSGNILEAIRAAITLPGIIVPPMYNGEPLLDGGMVNPVPVSVAREMGAEVVYAVDVSAGLLSGRKRRNGENNKQARAAAMRAFLKENMMNFADYLGPAKFAAGELVSHLLDSDPEPENISIFEAIMNSLSISQQALKEIQYKQYPPDALLTPDLSHMLLLDFHKAESAIEKGKECAQGFFSSFL